MKFKKPIALTALFGAMSAMVQASACISSESTVRVLLHSVPENIGDANFTGRILLQSSRYWFKGNPVKPNYLKVLESNTHPNLIGKEVNVPYILTTSCGPARYFHGQEGIIVGTLDPDQDDLDPMTFIGYKLRPEKQRFPNMKLARPQETDPSSSSKEDDIDHRDERQ